ncbi:MAG: GNAT family N-acetyltransferase [Calditrichaeota bacterium]|nr:MAG: GNAT family N-acetyltransferase [Calditrichota bacterium]
MHKKNTIIAHAEPEDLPAIKKLLLSLNLPTEGIENCLPHIYMAKQGEKIIGTIAMEIYGRNALLRSLAVGDNWQGLGISTQLYYSLAEAAKNNGIYQFYLLTDSVPAYFERLGFTHIKRDAFPHDVQTSVQFTSAICQTAAAMTKRL